MILHPLSGARPVHPFAMAGELDKMAELARQTSLSREDYHKVW